MESIAVYNRAFQLEPKDIFCVNVKCFLQTSSLWTHDFQILGVQTYKRKHWWQLWKPRKNIFIKIMYLGGNNNEQD